MSASRGQAADAVAQADSSLAELGRIASSAGQNLGTHALQQLERYVDLLLRWNKVYNLTAVRDRQEMLRMHIADSLAVVAPLLRQWQSLGRAPTGSTLLDVGSGAGLPGVVLAIALPELQVTCVDTVQKKAAFIQQVALALGLSNLRAVHARVEKLEARFDVVCSRAFASLSDFTSWSGAALAADGLWMAMKGKTPNTQMAGLPPTVEVFHVEQLQVAGLDADRCIVWMRKRARGDATK